MNIAKRRSIIAQRLEADHTVNVVQLAKEIGVSTMTVRRDLAELERQGFARRIHGGAVHGGRRSFEPTLTQRVTTNVEGKKRIAEAAVSMCNQDESIAIDVGSTTLFLAEALRDTQDLRLILLTPSILIGQILADNPSLSVLVTGGMVRRREYSLTGDLTIASLREFHVDRLFLGVAGISSETGLTEFNMEDTTVKKALIRSAAEVVVLADSEKFGVTALCRVCSFSAVDAVITDRTPPPPLLRALEKYNTRLIVTGQGDSS